MRRRLLTFAALTGVLLTGLTTAQATGRDSDVTRAFQATDRSTAWKLVQRVPLKFPTYHPQGIALVGDLIFLSSVEVLEAPVKYPVPVDGYDRTPGKGIGHVVLNSSTDKPWSQYFCCMVIGNSEFVRRNPIATKRALRALLKATDLCATEPMRTAQFLVDKGYVQNRDYALQTLSDVPYGKWRDYNSEDSVRFFALRLREVGMVKSSPQKLIAQGTDWRFLNELKRELKA